MSFWTSGANIVGNSNGSDGFYSGLGKDWLHNMQSPRGNAMNMIPGYNMYQAYTGWDAWKKNRAADDTNNWNNRIAAQRGWMNADMNERTALLKRYQGEDDAARTQAVNDVNAAYANPQREASYDQAYQARLADALAGVNQNYQQQSQQSGLAAAAKGRLGSSYDSEQRAKILGQAQMSALGAQGDASDYANSLRDADYQQAQALRRSYLAGDPQSAAAYQGLASAAAGQQSALAGQSSLIDRQRLLSQAYGNAQSQQLGGYGNALAGGVGAYYGAYGRS